MKTDFVSLGVTLLTLLFSILAAVGLSTVSEEESSRASNAGSSSSAGSSGAIHDGPRIYQGDPLFRGNLQCTVGLIDRAQRVAFTAAHCMYDPNRSKSKLVDYDGKIKAYDRSGEEIGTFVYPRKYIPNTYFPEYEKMLASGFYWADLVAIKLNDNVFIGENSYSGDHIINYADVHIGEKACFYGATTRMVSCGEILKKEPGQASIFFAFHNNNHSEKGDSGGPVWIPGRGVIGVLRGSDRDRDAAGNIRRINQIATAY